MTSFRVVAFAGMLTCAALPAVAQSPERGYVDVNFGLALAAEDTFDAAALFPYDAIEDIRFGATYSLPRGASFDFGGGFMITPFVGAGVSFSGTVHEDIAAFDIAVPHPRFLNAYGSDADVTVEPLQRVEGGVNIQAVVVLPTGPDVRVRLFGGPTYFRARQELLNEVRYLQTASLITTNNRIDITNSFAEEYEATGWGFHVGGDVSYFFTRIVGVGGFARISRGTVQLDEVDAADTGVEELKTGGFQIGGGLRLKF